MSKAKAIKPEVLPAVADQDEYAERVVSFHVAAGQHASAAVYCAAAAGAVMLQRKKSLGWGKGFTKWKENLVLPDGKRLAPTTADRYMALAKEIAARLKIQMAENPNAPLVGDLPKGQVSALQLLAEFDPTEVNTLRRQAVAEAVREVTNEQSLTQLYFDWGIAKRPKHRGGDHGGGKARSEQCARPEERKEMWARVEWPRIIGELRHFVLHDKLHCYLDPTNLHEGRKAIAECLDIIKQTKD